MKFYTGTDLRVITSEPLSESYITGNGFLRKGKSWIVGGKSGIGKSVFATQLACHLASGIDLLGMKINKPQKVLYINTENPFLDIQTFVSGAYENLQMMPDFCEDDLNKNIVFYNKQDIFSIPEFLKLLKACAEKHNPDVVIIDSLCSSVLCNFSDWDDCNKLFYSGFNAIKGRYGFAIVCIHHFGKTKMEAKTYPLSNTILGCSRITDWADSLSSIIPNKDGSYYIRHDKNFEHIENRYTKILQSEDFSKPFWRIA